MSMLPGSRRPSISCRTVGVRRAPPPPVQARQGWEGRPRMGRNPTRAAPPRQSAAQSDDPSSVRRRQPTAGGVDSPLFPTGPGRTGVPLGPVSALAQPGPRLAPTTRIASPRSIRHDRGPLRLWSWARIRPSERADPGVRSRCAAQSSLALPPTSPDCRGAKRDARRPQTSARAATPGRPASRGRSDVDHRVVRIPRVARPWRRPSSCSADVRRDHHAERHPHKRPRPLSV